MATDPVCGMYVDERTAELTLAREGRSYFFCSTACLAEFAAPERQLAHLRMLLAVAWPLSVLILVFSYVYSPSGWPWIALGLATVVEFYPGWKFYRGTYDAIRSRVWNMDILIAVGTTVAYAYSAAVVLVPGRFPPQYYFDASSLIVTLILSGNYLEHLTREKARGSLRKLKELLPTTASVVRGGHEMEVPIAEVQERDRVLVRPGGRFPADGIVVEGRSSVSEALLTGESFPVEKKSGDRVIAGSVNGEGVLTVEATKVGEDTLLAQIGQLVTQAETSRVPLQRLADRIAATFVPAVLVLAALAAVGWYVSGAGPTVALLVLVSVAITACPCAFGIATPAAIVVGTGRAAEEGVLFKGRDSLEQASRVTVVLTDKTGTLTRGEPILTDVLPAAGVDAREVLAIAGGLEWGSEHPLARAVRTYVRDRAIQPREVGSVSVEPGRGVRGQLDGRSVSILRGSVEADPSADLGGLRPMAERLDSEGKTWSLVLDAGEPLALLAFSDEMVPRVKETIAALEADGIRTVMVTGDRPAAAQRVAELGGIREVHAGVSPEAKQALIRSYQSRGERVAYVGDGINDAPALAAADLGIAIGAGTDVAKETGGVILVRPGFEGVAVALRAGRKTVQKVRGNLTWAFGYNGVLLPVAAGALVPLFGFGVYNVLPITGALAMGLSSASVVLNSLSLRWGSPAKSPSPTADVRPLPS
jgi:P-type Cu+ transporter